uniref:Uncharacterized protein n=1 Tax=Anguilla anguilla TaxID=7936 RepID=A0A0E9UJP2_ANGAN
MSLSERADVLYILTPDRGGMSFRAFLKGKRYGKSGHPGPLLKRYCRRASITQSHSRPN